MAIGAVDEGCSHQTLVVPGSLLDHDLNIATGRKSLGVPRSKREKPPHEEQQEKDA
jgi:hypothetical protein